MDIQAYIQSGIIESYVLGLATTEEVDEVEKLRLEYSEVNKAIQEFSEQLEEQARANAVLPPPDVRANILSLLQDESATSIPPVLPLYKEDTVTSLPVRHMRTWRFAAAASIILFLVSSAFNFHLYNRFKQSNSAYQTLLIERNSLQANNQVYETRLREWTTAAEMMADPKMAMIKMPGIKGKEDNMATVFWDTRNKDVYVMTNKLPKVVSGKQYQLWAIVNGKPVDAGVLDPTCTNLCKMKNMPQAQAFAITLENIGGSALPTMNALFVMGEV